MEIYLFSSQTVALSELPNVCHDLEDWYWQFGHLRTGREEISIPSWLFALREISEESKIQANIAQNSKPAFGFWGPSQVGKSTLFARYLDADLSKLGSALQWSESDPITFATGEQQLNPFNFRADGSACVSRFIRAETVPAPNAPVEIRLCSPRQILHFLASGYLSECDLREIKKTRSLS